ncbi:MAG: dTDP-4-dehydrorhamnose 3,5-epimerase family protein [Candidatus Spechtbacterales bacterium]
MEKSYKKVDTPIEGLNIYINKIVSDERGHFLDLAETDNPSMEDVKHLHASIATTKHIARGEHWHYKLTEHFYVMAGTALFILHDYNENSSTHGKTYALILGDGKTKPETELDSYYMDEGKLAQLEIPPMVYHAFMPLTDDEAVVFVSGNFGYDAEDYGRAKVIDIPGVKDILNKLNIEL